MAGHRIDEEQRLLRMNFLHDILKFFHQGLVDLEAARRIENQNIIVIVVGFLLGLLRDFNRRNLGSEGEEVHPDLIGDLMELINRGRTVNVKGSQ